MGDFVPQVRSWFTAWEIRFRMRPVDARLSRRRGVGARWQDRCYLELVGPAPPGLV